MCMCVCACVCVHLVFFVTNCFLLLVLGLIRFVVFSMVFLCLVSFSIVSPGLRFWLFVHVATLLVILVVF